MFGPALRYFLRHPARAVTSIAAEPAEAMITIGEIISNSRQRRPPADLYRAEERWDRRLHDLLGAHWPCPAIPEFWDLWSRITNELHAKDITVGPESFLGWNDGDAALVRAIWCLVRHLRPRNVIETGVAHGITSRFILEAMERNEVGHLWSIDRPPLSHVWHDQVGIAVGRRFPTRWSYIRGPSRLRLPPLLSKLGEIDLFVHDSLHSERNVRFEMDHAWAALRPGCAIVVDDVDLNFGFHTFTEFRPNQQSMICEAEPLRPDLRRFNKKGLFGIILKAAA
jgi:Methyltransferase domain